MCVENRICGHYRVASELTGFRLANERDSDLGLKGGEVKTELYSLSRIFTDMIFRIPDYQRGYAWKKRQYVDFWNDLVQLEPGKNHYTGVLTLEDVEEAAYKTWEDDVWVIEHKGFTPFYVVDGQQRLTTSVILIQAIVECMPSGGCLNFSTADEIRKRYIFDSRDSGVSRSYIFGYERDNPSYEFLKQSVFGEASESSSGIQETIYTSNLGNRSRAGA